MRMDVTVGDDGQAVTALPARRLQLSARFNF